MVVKNMDIWAISGDYNPNIEATTYSNSNQVIQQYKKVERKSTVPLKRIIKRNTAYTYLYHIDLINKSIGMYK